jgi:hypothetical protein
MLFTSLNSFTSFIAKGKVGDTAIGPLRIYRGYELNDINEVISREPTEPDTPETPASRLSRQMGQGTGARGRPGVLVRQPNVLPQRVEGRAVAWPCATVVRDGVARGMDMHPHCNTYARPLDLPEISPVRAGNGAGIEAYQHV